MELQTFANASLHQCMSICATVARARPMVFIRVFNSANVPFKTIVMAGTNPKNIGANQINFFKENKWRVRARQRLVAALRSLQPEILQPGLALAPESLQEIAGPMTLHQIAID